MTEPPEFSICIATHKRSSLLPTLLEGLSKQTGPSFEVVVVVDGDTDDSADVLRQLTDQLPLALRYEQVAHAGRGAALNRAFDLATGRFIVILDDDDQLTEGALTEMLSTWNGIPDNERPTFCGVVGLAVRPDGSLIGDKFPHAPADSDFFTMRQVRNVRGDKKEAFLRAALGDWRFPQISGELRVPTNLLWFELASRYRARFVNQPWVVKTYRPDGLTANGLKNKVASARLSALMNATALEKFPDMPLWLRLRFSVGYARFATHAGMPTRGQSAVVGRGLVDRFAELIGRSQAERDRRRLTGR
jgi:glycosyltransferase involved in cell wall biosynthesis